MKKGKEKDRRPGIYEPSHLQHFRLTICKPSQQTAGTESMNANKQKND